KFITQTTSFDVNLSSPVGATIASGGGTGVVTLKLSGQGRLSGEVFTDTNGDGSLGNGEPGLAGVKVELLDASNQVAATATTGSGGAYSFTIDVPGTYTVEELLPPGALLTTPAAGSYTKTLTDGQAIAGLNFGNFQTVSLGGEVYTDTDG